MEGNYLMEKIIRLQRIVSTAHLGTYGVLVDDGQPFCVTLEPPWVPDESGKSTPFKSCIPPGLYEAHRINSPRFGNTFQVMNVEEGHRTHILFHKGNAWKSDTLGCILLAEGYGGAGIIERSREGFREFMDRTRGLTKFLFQVTEDY